MTERLLFLQNLIYSNYEVKKVDNLTANLTILANSVPSENQLRPPIYAERIQKKVQRFSFMKSEATHAVVI